MKIVPLGSSNGAEHKNTKNWNNSWENNDSKRKINKKNENCDTNHGKTSADNTCKNRKNSWVFTFYIHMYV